MSNFLCQTCVNTLSLFLFSLCVSIVREGYPVDTPPLIQPGHTLTFYPPLSVVNLLPYDLHFLLSGREKGRILRKGEKLSHYDVSWSACTHCFVIHMFASLVVSG